MIRNCEERDLKELFLIFKSIYPFNPLLQSKPYFDWQFKNSPYNKSDGYTFLISTSEKSGIRGFIGYIPIEIVTPNGIVMACTTANWYSMPGGIDGVLLIEKLFSLYENILMIGLTEDSVAIYKAYNIPVLRELEFAVAVLDVNSVINLFPETIKQIDKLNMSKKTILGSNLSSNLYPKYGFDDTGFEMQYLSKDNSYSHIRKNIKYINWRYFEIPDHNYKMIRNSRGSSCFYRIEKIMDTPACVTHIVDWGVYIDDVCDILGSVVRDSLDNNSILIDFQSSEVSADLKNAGFILSDKIKDSIPRKYRPIQYSPGVLSAVKSNDDNINVANYNISCGDSDIDRIKL